MGGAIEIVDGHCAENPLLDLAQGLGRTAINQEGPASQILSGHSVQLGQGVRLLAEQINLADIEGMDDHVA